MDVRRFQKKPVIIEAVRVPTVEEFDLLGALRFVDLVIAIAIWCGGRSHMVDPPDDIETGIYIPTLEGEMRAAPGDWVIKGVKGEFYPCKPDIFEETYNEVYN